MANKHLKVFIFPPNEINLNLKNSEMLFTPIKLKSSLKTTIYC